ncbi:MAG TPA: GNAT family N-acetyltransferase [Kofleriaceae bacterium]|nr:GNAT family N-acetyltransferase [Kofleriaceae bacterium]
MMRHLTSEAEVRSAWPVMGQLRTHHTEESFVATTRRTMAAAEPYRLSAWIEDDRVLAVAGHRRGEALAWGRYVYVYDLVSDEAARGRGAAWRLVTALADEARAAGYEQLHLDSGVQRFAAHRFYLRMGFDITSHHFQLKL